MDPTSAMIMAGGNLLGGLMNTSSQQAINQQNLQFAQQQLQFQRGQAQGVNLDAYYKNLVAAGKDAGINPLALIGSSAGSGSTVSAPNLQSARPGDAISNALRQIGEAKFQKSDLQKLQEAKIRSDIKTDELMRQIEANKYLRSAHGTASNKLEGPLQRAAGPETKLDFPLGLIDQTLGLGGKAVDYISKWWDRQHSINPFSTPAQ